MQMPNQLRSKSSRKLIFWTPRVLTILFTLFLALFALDVFGQGYSTRDLLLALFMHLIPNMLMLVVLAVAWRHQYIGGSVFIFLALAYTIKVSMIGFPFGALPIAGPAFLIGALFWLDGYLPAYRPCDQIRPHKIKSSK